MGPGCVTPMSEKKVVRNGFVFWKAVLTVIFAPILLVALCCVDIMYAQYGVHVLSILGPSMVITFLWTLILLIFPEFLLTGHVGLKCAINHLVQLGWTIGSTWYGVTNVLEQYIAWGFISVIVIWSLWDLIRGNHIEASPYRYAEPKDIKVIP